MKYELMLKPLHKFDNQEGVNPKKMRFFGGIMPSFFAKYNNGSLGQPSIFLNHRNSWHYWGTCLERLCSRAWGAAFRKALGMPQLETMSIAITCKWNA